MVANALNLTEEGVATRTIVSELDARVLIPTFDLDEYAFECLRAGASGFLLKCAPLDVLHNAIRAIVVGTQG